MEPVTILVLVLGVFITLLTARGLYESRRETMEGIRRKETAKIDIQN